MQTRPPLPRACPERAKRVEGGGYGGVGAKTSWEPVAEWYGAHARGRGTLIAQVVHPGAIRLLAPKPGQKILDIACGEGALSRLLARAGADVTGVDASPALIKQAERQGPAGARYVVADATRLDRALPFERFDAAVCTLALQNIEAFADVFRAAAAALKPGAPFVFVLNHPCFRVPRQSGWGWDEGRKLQYRRVDTYLSSYRVDILAHPGGDRRARTFTYHRPLSAYVQALAAHGFVVEAMEEWTSNRESKPGGRSRAENAAREEIPLFLAIRAVVKK